MVQEYFASGLPPRPRTVILSIGKYLEGVTGNIFLPLNLHSSHGVYVTPGVSASLHTAVGFHRATYEPLVPVPGKHGVAMTTEGKEL